MNKNKKDARFTEHPFDFVDNSPVTHTFIHSYAHIL